MEGQSDHRKRLADLLGEVAVNEGMHRTSVEGVEVARVSKPVPRAPVVYQPKILIVGQGRKRAYLGGEVYQYDSYNYGSSGVSGGWFEEQPDQGSEEGFAPPPDVVHELEEPQVQRRFLLRDTPVRSQPAP